jgi:predicted ATPase/class 3 adenylate cyclase/tRNA A-37 threonylcarbamoyl transferase component Bud32
MIASPTIPGYNITGVLKQTKENFLVKAFGVAENRPVLLKILNFHLDRGVLHARLKREADLVERYSLDTMVKPIAIFESEEQLVSVMEDFGNCTLEEYATQYPLPIETFFEIATEIILSVSELHKNGVNHNRLYPGNFLFNTETLKVKLLDLETASLLNNLSTQPVNLSNIAGELAYLAPEQSGRMNRQIDLRSNLYSLGCIFYEMLTGQAVFESEGFTELVYAHMAKKPRPVYEVNNTVPKVVNNIIIKLLNKNAEDRYQTIFGLRKDIEKCKKQLANNTSIESFTIAKHDVSETLSFPQKLFGRDEEIKLILDTFEEVKKGDFAVLMIGGYSGIGKTSLVNEARKTIFTESGFFIRGKYDLLERNIAFSALLNALTQFLQQKLAASEEERKDFVLRLESKLQGQGQLVIDVLPELELLIGSQPKMPVLPLAEAQNRFLDVLCRFVSCFATEENPLTIFIDDLQWADLSTIKFLTKFSQYQHNQYVCFIGAYRDNEVSSVHPLIMCMAEMKSLNVNIKAVSLSPLSEIEVNAFIADTLKQSEEKTFELSQIIAAQTGANPFFLKLFVNRLVKDKLLFLDTKSYSWKWDIKAIKQAGITENVIELLTQDIEQLPEGSKDVLKLASCIGNSFDLLTLNKIIDISSNEIARNLWQPLSQNFIIPLDENYTIAETIVGETPKNVRYKFSHDRAQQAVYNLLNDEERLQMHHDIAERLYQSYDNEELNKELFNVVNHFNIALPLIVDKEKQSRIRELNLNAGDRANEVTSFTTALAFYKKAVALFDESEWNSNHDAIVEAYLKLAESEYICGDYDNADKLYALILSKTKNPASIAKVYDIQLRQYAQQGRNKETLKRGVSILKKYKVDFIVEPSSLQVLPKLIYTKLMLMGKDVSKFSELPPTNSQEKAFAIQTLMNISATAYVYNPKTMLLLVLRMVQLSVKYGNSPESAFGYGLFGFVEGAALGNVKKAKEFADLSISLVQDIENPIIEAKVRFLRAFSTQHWFEPIPLALPELLESFKVLDQSGSYTFAGYSLQALMDKRLFLGKSLAKYLEDISEFAKYADRVQESFTQNLLLILQCYATALTGVENEALKSHQIMLDEEAYLKSLTEKRLLMPVAWHYVYNQLLHYYMGDFELASRYAKKARIVDEVAPTTMAQIEHHFYSVLLYAEEYQNVAYSKKLSIRMQVGVKLKKLKKWARDCPENFMLRYQIANTAWLVALNPDGLHNEEFVSAYSLAEGGTNLCLQALILELWAKQLFKGRDVKKGLETINVAIKKYQEWGANAKVKQLYERYFPVNIIPKSNQSKSLDDLIDVESILKASQVISGDIVLDKLLGNLLAILMENAGAQRGFLILNKDGLHIEASQDGEDEKPTLLQSQPISETDLISSTIANYVWRTGNHVMLDDAQMANKFSSDPYLHQKKVRSVLSVAIKNQGKSTAVIYLENNLATKVFTESRLAMITALASQAAISIENALLYNSLEQKVQDRTLELVNANKRTDELLLNILPASIADELKEKGEAATKVFNNATILFADFKNFTKVVEFMDPEDLVKLIDTYFSEFDEIMKKHDIEKIKTVGDAYISAGGLPDPLKGSPKQVVDAAIEMLDFAKRTALIHEKNGIPSFEIRIGINTGSVIAGVVGKLKFAYDIWGDTVNTAARLEQNSEGGKINISASTYKAVKNYYNCIHRGKIDAKNKGEIDMYFVDV